MCSRQKRIENLKKERKTVEDQMTLAEDELQKTADLANMLSDSKTVCLTDCSLHVLYLMYSLHSELYNYISCILLLLSMIQHISCRWITCTHSPVLLCRNTNSWQHSWMVPRLTWPRRWMRFPRQQPRRALWRMQRNMLRHSPSWQRNLKSRSFVHIIKTNNLILTWVGLMSGFQLLVQCYSSIICLAFKIKMCHLKLLYEIFMFCVLG